MKKLLLILAILFLVAPSFAQLPCMSQLKVEVDLPPNTGSYDAMGLVLGHIHVINLDTVPVEISIYGDKIIHLKMESDVSWIRLEGCTDNALAEWQDIMVSVPPSDTFAFTFNFNILDFVLKKYKADSTIINQYLKCEMNAGVLCGNDSIQEYLYSPSYRIKITPVSGDDANAFVQLYKSGYNPSAYTDDGWIRGWYSNQSYKSIPFVLENFPNSTFAQSAKLNLAYRKHLEEKLTPAIKSEIATLLEVPLQSQYSYIRYLAEKLRKKVNN